jgi:hypothetical protein
MNVVSTSLVRPTRKYEAMLQSYRDVLSMKPAQSWDHPGNRGTLLSPGENVDSAVIEVIEWTWSHDRLHPWESVSPHP